MKKQYLENGSFGKKKIYYQYIKNIKKSDEYLIFIPGTYGSSCYDRMYLFLIRFLKKYRKYNLFTFETSRKIYSFETTLDYLEYKNTFKGKTFGQELQDVEKIFEFFISHIVTLDKSCKLYLVGFSLGGTLSTYLLPKYAKYIKHLFLFNSGITTKHKSWPVLKKYPAQQEILHNLNNYQNKISLVQGSEDNVVDPIKARKLATCSLGAEERELVIWKGIDHSFRKRFGKEDTKFIMNKVGCFINSRIN
jgi:predicted esterase